MTRSWLAPFGRMLAGTFLAWLALAAPARAADDEEAPTEVPVTVEGTVDTAGAADLGIWDLTIQVTPLDDVHRPYRIELRVFSGAREILQLDHPPGVPAPQWCKGKAISWTVPIPIPYEAGLTAGDRLDVRLGFFDPVLEKTIPPVTDEFLRENRLVVAVLDVPDIGPSDAEDVWRAIVERAEALAAGGRKADAFQALERGLRRAEEDPTKTRFRDAMLALGHFEPAPLSLLEKQIVAARIDAEKRRWLRKEAGRCFDRKFLYAALRILEAVGGSLSEQADAAVIGAVAEADRAQKDIQQLRVRLLARISDEDKAAARKAVAKHGVSTALLKQARAWRKAGLYARARHLFREVALSSDRDLAPEGREQMDALDEEWLQQTPPDEARLVEEALNHPAFGRLDTVATHEFVFIGPKTLVRTIPEVSRLRFDVAYVFLTDLFGRLPNPGGDRITVFWKELWDFGGGQAGAKTIDIGRADPKRRGYRVDTGLLYHELTHCVDDTLPIFVGWREGLANMGAAYSFEALGQPGDEQHAFQSNLDAFQNDYLGRDLAYWRIPGYGPSAGFFLHFVEAHSKTPYGHDWKPFRTFFREYRASPVKDGRVPFVARAFAYFLVRAFGEAAFDDLLAFRLPLIESDRKALALEVEAFAKGEYGLARLAHEFRSFPNSPLTRDLKTRELIGLARNGRTDPARRLADEQLGIIHDWWVIGPFRSEGADPRLHVFAPEHEIDLSKEYADAYNVCKWRPAGKSPVVTVDPKGWVSFRFSYQDDTATYALTHVIVPEETEAYAYLRADDDVRLFVNDRLVEGYVDRGRNGSDWLWWRGPAQPAPDAVRFPVRLKAGRNRLLVKVKNRRGAAGFVLALCRRDGGPLADRRIEADPLASEETEAGPTTRAANWTTVVRHVFRTRSFSAKLETAVGAFKVVNRRLVGQATDKRVAWRKYTVRPGFPKDAPSNLAWLKPKHTEGVSDFRLSFDLETKAVAPKIVVTFQGEGETDGLSGWNLIVHPRGKTHVGARLERYDRVVYQTRALEPPSGETLPLVLELRDGRLTATLGDLELFRDVPVPVIPDRHRIGFSTFGPGLGLLAFRLETPK